MTTPVTISANNPSTTATSSSGTTAPSAGTTETWTMTSSASFPAASNSAIPPTQFHIGDPVLPAEYILVTNISGTTWSVTRGAEGSTPVAHASAATYYQVFTAADLNALLTKAGGALSGALSTTPATLTDASSIAVNAALSGVFRVTLGGNRTLANPTNPKDGQSITVEVIQDGTGSRTLAYGTAYSFTASTPQPSLSTAAGDRDLISFFYDAGAALWICTGYILAQNAILVTIAQGGTGQTTQQAAINALTGAQTSGYYLRSGGTNAVLAAIQAADLPTATTSAQGAVELDGTASDIQPVSSAAAAGAIGKSADSGHVHPASSITPADQGMLAWSLDLDSAASGVTLVAGTVYLNKIPIRSAITATYLWFTTTSAGSGASSGSYVGLYSSAGTLLTGSSDLGASITNSNHQVALTTPQSLTAGFVWAAIVTNQASTQPSLRSPFNYTYVVSPNIGLSAATARVAIPGTSGTSQTSLPSSFTPSALTNVNAAQIWFGIS
jgi:hypothetical protein